ncbi:MAG: phosphate ABC transporter substrate-binding protein [Planctomycetota bacterium]|mgnify:CR=1 FL=1
MKSWVGIAVVAACLAGCGKDNDQAGGGKTTITIKGSDTMVILGQRWAEEYMKARGNVVVQVTGGGSGTGIAALINGTTEICMASRPMKDKEKGQLQEKQKKDAHEISVALDGIAVFVHESNPLQEASLEELRGVYTGKTTAWWGGKSDPIVAYGRENNSGTYVYFKEHVLANEDFAENTQTLPGTAAVINAVSKDKNAIGYGGIGYLKGVKALKVKKDAATPASEPSMENVVSGAYPISRSLYFYTGGAPTGAVKEFIDWCTSAEGQKVCELVGYYPIPTDKQTPAPAAH